MVIIQYFQEIIESLDKTKLLTLPKCKQKAMKIEFGPTHDNKTEINPPNLPLPFAASEVFSAHIKKWRRLTADDVDCKAVYEVSFDIEGSNFNFQPGDTVGIIPQNRQSEVEFCIEHLGLKDVADMNYTLSIDSGQKGVRIPPHIPVESTLRHVLTNCVDLRGIVKKLFLLALSQYTKDEFEKQVLEYLCSKEGSSEYSTHILNKSANVLDIFKLFKSCKPPVEVILEHLPRLLPRPYSIVNRQSDANVLKVSFSVMEINNKKGLTTGWLEEILLQKNNIEEQLNNLNLNNECVKVPLYLRKNINEFSLPESTETPLILIGPGTGISPFIGFLEELEYLKKNSPDKEFGDVWVFFGCRNPKLDFIYEDELKKFASDGVIKKFNTAFSRYENTDFRYVQDAILGNGEEVTELLTQGARVYVCEDIKTMAAQVKYAFIECLVKHGNKTKGEADDYVLTMQKEKRYLNDIWN